jgi:DNA-binding response OmpR family regulator
MSQQALLVEDDEVLRRIIRINLAKRGLVVREAGSCEAAFLALADLRPDVLILDLNLPDGNGGDLLREVRRRGIAAPAVIITAGPARPGYLTDFLPLWYLPKPFQVETLLDLVWKAVGSPSPATPDTPDGEVHFGLRSVNLRRKHELIDHSRGKRDER